METKLKIGEILEIYSALPKLDKSLAGEPYAFDFGTRWNIAKNLKILKGEVEVYEESRVAKIIEISPVNRNVAKESPEKQEQFSEWNNKLRKTEVVVNGLLKLKRTQLLAENNSIPGTVLADIMLIVEDDGDPKPKPEANK